MLNTLTRELTILSICLLGIDALSATNRPIRVAVIDSGIDAHTTNAPLCPGLSRDFTGLGLMDVHGHGTHVSDVIDQYTKNEVRIRAHFDFNSSYLNKSLGYCQVALKYYDSHFNGEENLTRSNAAIAYAISIGVDAINYSGGGYAPQRQESNLIKRALDVGIKIFAAAGNDGAGQFDTTPTDLQYFPALYDTRIVVVGNLSQPGLRHASSNWGARVNHWEIGTSVLGAAPHHGYAYLTGTSQATAIATGKYIRKLLKERN